MLLPSMRVHWEAPKGKYQTLYLARESCICICICSSLCLSFVYLMYA